MSFNRSIIFGSIAGVAGAALWAAIAYFVNLEIGWLALGIGFAVGSACVVGAGYGSKLIGTTAAIITLLAILLGKFATVELAIQNDFGDVDAAVQESIAGLNDEMLTSYVADEVIEELAAKGESVSWPQGVDPDTASTKAEYPPEIWAQAAEHWGALSAEEKQEYQVSIEASIREGMAENFDLFQDEVRKQGFLLSFGFMDLVFFALAIYTAFSVGQSGGGEENPPTHDPNSEDTIPALR